MTGVSSMGPLRGVILAGGRGTRLLPMTRVVNKHLLPVYDRPMIYYPLASLRSAGIREVCVVVGGREPAEVQELLGDGRELGFDRLSFATQNGENGIAAALACARAHVADAPMCVILGDNILEDSLAPFAARFLASDEEAMVLLRRVRDPERFGVPSFDDAGRVVEIVEKPAQPSSDLAVVGVYFYRPSVWQVIETISPSGRGELEISDVNNVYARRGQLAHGVLTGFWGDAGTADGLFEVAAAVREWKPREA
ncbi:MAG TPA: sugar phosphate nucleotidyltransferase [Gemmatimonadales bacterium]